MKLVRDVLDKQLLGRDEKKLGKVDGIVIELRDDEPPKVAAIECGFAVAAARVSKHWARFAVAMGERFGVRKTPHYRIAWEKVIDVGIDVEVDVDADESPQLAWEKWLRKHFIKRIPF